MNTIGSICGWIIFNIMRKSFHILPHKTVVGISSSNAMIIKLEYYLYIGIAIIKYIFRLNNKKQMI